MHRPKSIRAIRKASEEYANELAEGEFPDDFDRRYVKLGAHLFPPHEDVVSVATYQFDEPELVKDETKQNRFSLRLKPFVVFGKNFEPSSL